MFTARLGSAIGPDQRRRDRLAVVRHGGDDLDREPVLTPEPPHQLHVARPSAPEPVVVAQDQLLHPEPRAQHVAHEIFGAETRELGREGDEVRGAASLSILIVLVLVLLARPTGLLGTEA